MERKRTKQIDNTLPLWLKMGGGSLRIGNKLIKPNERFYMKESDIPNAFRKSVQLLEDGKNGNEVKNTDIPTTNNTKTTTKVRGINKTITKSNNTPPNVLPNDKRIEEGEKTTEGETTEGSEEQPNEETPVSNSGENSGGDDNDEYYLTCGQYNQCLRPRGQGWYDVVDKEGIVMNEQALRWDNACRIVDDLRS